MGPAKLQLMKEYKSYTLCRSVVLLTYLKQPVYSTVANMPVQYLCLSSPDILAVMEQLTQMLVAPLATFTLTSVLYILFIQTLIIYCELLIEIDKKKAKTIVIIFILFYQNLFIVINFKSIIQTKILKENVLFNLI